MKIFLILILICFIQNIFSQATKEDDLLVLTVGLVDKTIPKQTVYYSKITSITMNVLT